MKISSQGTALTALLFVSFNAVVSSLQCHSCAAADSIPTYVNSAIETLNLTDIPLKGDCKATTGTNMCSNGQFCMKNAVVYKLGINKINYDWSTYQKSCVDKQPNGDAVSSGCKDIETTQHDGYKKIIRQCYCNNKDFCNGSAGASLLSLISILVIMTSF